MRGHGNNKEFLEYDHLRNQTPTRYADEPGLPPHEQDIMGYDLVATTILSMDLQVKQVQEVEDLVDTIGEQNTLHSIIMQSLADSAMADFCAFTLAQENSGVWFGKHNWRPINKSQAGGLIRTFSRLGLQVTDPACVIHMALKPEWYKGNLANSLHGKGIVQLPRLIWTKASKEALCKGLIHAFLGNHSRYTLNEFLKSKSKQVKAIQAEVRHLTPKPGKATLATSSTYIKYKDKLELLETLKSQLTVLSLWGVQVYDYGQ